MEFSTSDRGFKHFRPVPTDYGAEVLIYESSAAMKPHIWLRISQPEPTQPGQLPAGSVAAHMSIEQAEEIRDLIDAAIQNHYQLQED